MAMDLQEAPGSPAPPAALAPQRADKPDAGSSRVGIALPAPSLKLIRTGQLSLEVPSFDRAVAELERLVKAAGGYVSDSTSMRNPSGSLKGTVTLRIPSERFEGTGDSARKLGKVLSSRTSVQDVTREYADLETRIRVKREAADRMRELLRSRTSSMGDIIEVQRALNQVIEEIETSEGQRRLYDHQVAFSTLIVELTEPESFVSMRPSSWEPLKDALGDSGRVLAGSIGALIVILVAVLPWLVLAWGILWLVLRLHKRRKARKQAVLAAVAVPREPGSPPEPPSLGA